MENERRHTQDEMLGRIEALTEANSREIVDLRSMNSADHAEMKLLLEKYVTKDEFNPIKNIVYGMVGIILTGSFFEILRLVFR